MVDGRDGKRRLASGERVGGWADGDGEEPSWRARLASTEAPVPVPWGLDWKRGKGSRRGEEQRKKKRESSREKGNRGGSYRLSAPQKVPDRRMRTQDRLFADKQQGQANSDEQHQECRHDQPDVASSAPPRQDAGQNMGRPASWRC
ncbi:hypothetical protein PVAR5_6540 [Paecilomyces variotii No. 5]|uniref:Uncharacterized protein n=1 Tax=Byssochlamys spectabilis (strain No. 5 / NBRC 109023) TaxID=1356009 RepID=V5GAC3_BYSSN|nr:hypothetical protein PVAR5_6540 [Paecilomyces variotii No. 5]